MNIVTHRNFDKAYIKLSEKMKIRFKDRRDLFLKDPYHHLLHNHPLTGKYKGYRSFNVTSDLRVIFKQLSSDTALFFEIGTHSQLYK